MISDKFTVLVIDDEKKVRNQLKKHLSTEGYEVITASMEEVNLKLEAKQFDFVIVDLNLTSEENYGGIKIIQYINNKLPLTKILILSGYNKTETINEELKNVRYNEYLSKGEKGNYIENVIEKLHNMKQKQCFVIMPFSKEFKNIYELGIKLTIKELGMHCSRVDELHFSKSILSQIYNGIEKANFLIADMTGKNSNVFYEVGYAHALRKEVILLNQNSKDISFDFKDMSHIFYDKDNLPDLMNRLKKRVEAMISGDYILHYISVPSSGRTPFFV